MARTLVSINLDRLVDAMFDAKSVHYWDVKRNKLIPGSTEDEEIRPGRVLVDGIGGRKFKRLASGFAKLLDSKDAKQIDDVARQGPDKFYKLLEKRPPLKKEWVRYAGAELAQTAIDWLGLQGVDEFIATGELARYLEESDSVELSSEDGEE